MGLLLAPRQAASASDIVGSYKLVKGPDCQAYAKRIPGLAYKFDLSGLRAKTELVCCPGMLVQLDLVDPRKSCPRFSRG